MLFGILDEELKSLSLKVSDLNKNPDITRRQESLSNTWAIIPAI
jgi:hypothetical protein